MRSVSVPFLTKWCWNSVCLPCWSDDHGTLFELHGKINGKSAQHPWWHQGLLVEHLQYNKAVNYWLRKVAVWVAGGGGRRRGGRGRGLASQIFTYKEGQKCWDTSVVVKITPLPLCTSTPFPQSKCWILDSRVFLLLQTTWIRGWGSGIYGVTFKQNEIINERNCSWSARFRQVCQLLFTLIVS